MAGTPALELVSQFAFGPREGGSGTVSAMPLLDEGRLTIGAFCFDRDEWFGLFWDDGSPELQGRRLPADIVRASLDSFVQPVASSKERVIALAQFMSVHPSQPSAAALVVVEKRSGVCSVWRSIESAICARAGVFLAWRVPGAVEVLDLKTGATKAVVAISMSDGMDGLACDSLGQLVAAASGPVVHCFEVDGERIGRWTLQTRCNGLMFAEQGHALFAFTRGGGLFELRPSGEVIDLAPLGSAWSFKFTCDEALVVRPDGCLHQIDLRSKASIMKASLGSPEEMAEKRFQFDIDPRSRTVAVLNRSDSIAQLFRFSF